MQSNIPLSRVTLDSSIAIKLTMGSQMLKERALMARNDAWHRVKIIRGARYDKEVVLRSILLAVEPADLIPVRYQVNGEDAYFMARNCGAALEMLCRSNLIINLANGDPIVIIVTLAFASIHELKINIQPILLSALTRRYDVTRKYLRLNDFHRDEEIARTVYCPLSQSKTLGHCLKLAKTALGPFEHLNLQNNELLNTIAMENSNLPSLRALDLRNNYLMAMDALAPLKSLRITELWLDGNPLCENYANAERYVESARRYCPHLTKLDGVTLDAPRLPQSYDDHFRSEDARKLAHQFLDHFYGLYDNDRTMMRDLYHRNALFSLTLGVAPGGGDAGTNLGPFALENRDLLRGPDYAKEHQRLHHGPDEIIEAFARLPKSLHNRSGFKVDAMFEDRQRILLSVEGVFRVSPDSLPLAFSRTFFLVGREENEYNILNDQLHVGTAVAASAFNNVPSREELARDRERVMTPTLSPREKERLIFTLMDVTTMSTEWCHRFLEDANWNARRAIKKFMESYKASSIPVEAFGR